MSISVVNNIFLQEEIDSIYERIKTKEPVLDTELGRVVFYNALEVLDYDAISRLSNIVKNITDLPLTIFDAAYVEYNSLYGKPNLPPHFDGDSSDLIITIQVESNVDWALGLNLETYHLKDNSALIFNQNKEIHWRVHKEFNDGDYVRMFFVRLCNPENMSDYSHLRLNQNDDVFKDVVKFRDSLGTF
jgi:hypothetical protein